jgi:hypothetical protein
MGETIKGYKGFNKDMTCRGKQYKENTTYEEDGTEICEAGMMHFCENPYDVLDYYPLVNEDGDISDFAEVEAVGEVKKDGNKSETNKLHIGAKLGLKGFVKACVDFTIEKTRIENAEECTDYDNGKNYAQIGSSGYSAQIGSSGDYAQITSIGKNSVVMAAGYNSIARAKIGSWITLAEWVETGEKNENGFYIWIPKCVKTEYVDGERIKENTFYKLVDGEFKECE